MNAARARQAQGNQGAANNLANYSNQQFNKQHFGGQNDPTKIGDGVNGGNGFYQQVGRSGDNVYDGQQNALKANVDMNQGTMTDKRSGDWDNPYDATETYTFNNKGSQRQFSRGIDRDSVNLYKPKNVPNNGNLNRTSNVYNQKKQNVGNDLNGYYNGQSQYVKGQGWR